MRRLRLAPRADLGVYYDADAARYRHMGGDILKHVSRDYVISRYSNCPSIGFEYDGQPIGGIVFDGQHAHIAVLPAWHGRWAILLRPALNWLFSLQAEILVKVEVDNAVCLEFMRRNGWPAIATYGDNILYRMTLQDRHRRRSVDHTDRIDPTAS